MNTPPPHVINHQEPLMLHPQTKALLAFIEERGIPPTHTLSPDEARRIYRERRGALQPEPPAVGEVRELARRTFLSLSNAAPAPAS